MTTKSSEFPGWSLPPNASKAQQVAYLEAFVSALPPGSYIGQMLTPDLVDAFREATKVDNGFDVLGEVNRASAALSEALGEVAKCRNDIDTRNRLIADLRHDLKNLQAGYDAHIAGVRNILGDQEATIHECAEELRLAKIANAALEQRVAVSDHEVLRLKARLYDIMSGETK